MNGSWRGWPLVLRILLAFAATPLAVVIVYGACLVGVNLANLAFGEEFVHLLTLRQILILTLASSSLGWMAIPLFVSNGLGRAPRIKRARGCAPQEELPKTDQASEVGQKPI